MKKMKQKMLSYNVEKIRVKICDITAHDENVQNLLF